MLNKIDIKDIIKIALKAGEEILKIYNKDFEVEYKDDKSPLTEADKVSHQIIVEGLKVVGIRFKDNIKSNTQHPASNTQHQTLNTFIPILSEEGKDVPYEERKNWEYFWLVDPLDGTKEFIKKNGEFTINIALVHKGEPVLGVVYAPVTGEMFFGRRDAGAYKMMINSEDAIDESLKNAAKLPIFTKKDVFVVVASKSHMNKETQDFIENLKRKINKPLKILSRGSSLKLCMVAEGSADIYPRLAPTMEWDIAAADAILRSCSKKIYCVNSNKPIQYNKRNLTNCYFVAE